MRSCPPRVSVVITAYNHEKFIAKTLDSVLMQRTNFPYEIVIGEDCSTDNTRNILISYQQRFPDIFRLLLHEKNLGAFKNGKQVLEACTGDYIACLEGDDYWLTPEKMQKQVDFLDLYPHCSTCFHDALIVYEDGSKESTSYRPRQNEFSTVENLLLDNFIPTAAVMFRRGLFGTIPDWISRLKMADWPLHILNAVHGDIGYIDETMSAYVVHRGGMWSLKDWRAHEPDIIELFEALHMHLDRKYSAIITRILRWRNLTLAMKFEHAGEVDCARRHAVKALFAHLRICFETGRHSCNEFNIAAPLPVQLQPVAGFMLLKKVLRLTVAPLVEPYPALSRFIKTTARALNLSA